MLKLFFYKRVISDKESVSASFNVDLVTQTLTNEDGTMMQVFLNDFHEELREIDLPRKNGGKSTELRAIEVCSTIILQKEDANRFRDLYEAI